MLVDQKTEYHFDHFCLRLITAGFEIDLLLFTAHSSFSLSDARDQHLPADRTLERDSVVNLAQW